MGNTSLVHGPATEAASFLGALFGPDDLICFRPIETWVEEQGSQRRKRSRVDFGGCTYAHVGRPGVAERIMAAQRARSESERTNVFFGVAPRFDRKRFDEAWQIRRVTALWSDIDYATPEEANERIANAGLPPPSIVVASGNGTHVYWLLDATYLIDDVGDPPAIERETLGSKPGEKKKLARWFRDPKNGERVDLLPGAHNAPPLSAKAILFQDILAGLAAKIGGDHTTDVSRILRVPGTLNRKDQRNGRPPVPCVLHSLDVELRYPFELLRPLADSSPSKSRREAVAKVKLPRTRKPSPGRQDKLNELALVCDTAAVGDRSEADFGLCCWAIEKGIAADLAWSEVRGVGKFKERGEDYFRRTWEAAAGKTREKTYDRVQQEAKRRADRHDNSVSGERIIVVGPDEHRVADEAIEALAGSTSIFQRLGSLVQIVRDAKPPKGVKRPANLPTIVQVQNPRLRKELSARATWMRENDEKLIRVSPPDNIVSIVASNGEWPGVRPLEGIVECPTLRPDGSILDQPGYDEYSGLMVMLSGEFPRVPSNPTRQDALQAFGELAEVFQDFPLATPAHRTVPLAAVLTLLARHAINGPLPLFGLDANAPGSGKGLACDAVAIIATGREMSRYTAPEKSEEWSKALLSIALGGERIVLFDNVNEAFGDKALDAVLTARTCAGRILATNNFVSGVPVDAAFFVTGNNLEFRDDTPRRTLLARIQCLEEQPENRSDFAHADLLEWVKEQRPRLVRAGLTILRAYIVAGRPKAALPPWGSYNAWSDWIRQPLVWLGLPDPAETRIELPSRSTNDRAAHLALMDGWEELGEATAAEVIHAIDAERSREPQLRQHDELRKAIEQFVGAAAGGELLPKSLGHKLRRLEGRVIEGRYFACRDTRNGLLWTVKHVDTPKGSATSGFSVVSPKALRAEEQSFISFPVGHRAARESPESTESARAKPTRCGNLRN